MISRRLALAALPLLLAGCPSDPCADAPCLLSEDLAQGLLSVRAVADDDVWVVGASPAPDTDGPAGPLAARFDGSAWSGLDLSAWDGLELWWVHPMDDEVVLVGSRGTILEHDRAAGTTEQVVDAGADALFFGVWGASPDDLWAVGEGPSTDGNGDPIDKLPIIYRRQGGTWAPFEDPGVGPGLPNQVYFKVHGRAADDLWIVGTNGIAMHWDGADLTPVATDTEVNTDTAPLLTVDASGERPVAVGGAGSGLLLEFDGTDWRDMTPEFQPPYNGVCTGPDGAAAAVGRSGTRALYDGAAWVPDLDAGVDALTLLDYHACAYSPSGALWMVGGRIAQRPLSRGVLAYSGPGHVPALTSNPGGSE